MLLSEIFDHLTYGELSQLSIGGREGSGVLPSDLPAMLSHVNIALNALFTRFPVVTKEILVQQYEHISNYTLDAKYAITNTESTAPYKYIVDSIHEPFISDVLRIESIHDEDGQEYFLNDPLEYWSVHIPSYNIIQIPFPIKENAMSVQYRAKHPILKAQGLEIETAIINLPDYLLEPLLLHIASRAFASNPSLSPEQNGLSSGFAARYENACRLVEEHGLLHKEDPTNIKLRSNGWV